MLTRHSDQRALAAGVGRTIPPLVVERLVGVATSQLFLGPSEHASPGAVDERDQSVVVDGVEPVGHRAHDDAVVLLGAPLLGDVEHNGGDRVSLAIRIANHRRHDLEPESVTLVVETAVDGGPKFLETAPDRIEIDEERLHVGRMQETEDRAADEVGLAVAHQLAHCRVHRLNPAVDRQAHLRHLAGREVGAVVGLRVSKSLGGSHPVRDVPTHTHRADDPPRILPEGMSPRLDVAESPVLVLDDERPLRIGLPRGVARDASPIDVRPRGQQHVDLLFQRLESGPSVELLGRAVPTADDSALIRHDDRNADALRDPARNERVEEVLVL